MELKEGMYVRTKYGIAKIIQNNFKDENMDEVLIVDRELEFGYLGSCDEHLCSINHVIKASYNIIDLIEVGDYVNGCRVHRIANCITIILDNEENISWVKPSDIKSIVTKEQFESMSYKVGE